MTDRKFDCSRCTKYKYKYSVGSPYENFCSASGKDIPLQTMKEIRHNSLDEFFSICNFVKVVNIE